MLPSPNINNINLNLSQLSNKSNNSDNSNASISIENLRAKSISSSPISPISPIPLPAFSQLSDINDYGDNQTEYDINVIFNNFNYIFPESKAKISINCIDGAISGLKKIKCKSNQYFDNNNPDKIDEYIHTFNNIYNILTNDKNKINKSIILNILSSLYQHELTVIINKLVKNDKNQHYESISSDTYFKNANNVNKIFKTINTFDGSGNDLIKSDFSYSSTRIYKSLYIYCHYFLFIFNKYRDCNINYNKYLNDDKIIKQWIKYTFNIVNNESDKKSKLYKSIQSQNTKKMQQIKYMFYSSHFAIYYKIKCLLFGIHSFDYQNNNRKVGLCYNGKTAKILKCIMHQIHNSPKHLFFIQSLRNNNNF